jgi:hypothetical protein
LILQEKIDGSTGETRQITHEKRDGSYRRKETDYTGE